MKTEIKLTKNMSVYASDDEKIGAVKHVVVDPSTSKITHLVIEQGFIFTTDKVLPIELISKQVDEALYVDRSSDSLNLREYEQTFYVSQYESDYVDETIEENENKVEVESNPAVIPQSVYYYPPTPNRGLGMHYWGVPGGLATDPVQTVNLKNIPYESVVIEEGENVYSKDGDHVGDVHSVHIDSETNRVTHFVISQGLVFKDYKLIPRFWISEVNDDGIIVGVETDQLKKLPEYDLETA